MTTGGTSYPITVTKSLRAQQIAAENVGLSVEVMLALQVAGAAAGNAVCINNILAARAVMALTHIPEGRFIARTAPLCAVFLVVATLVALAIMFA